VKYEEADAKAPKTSMPMKQHIRIVNVNATGSVEDSIDEIQRSLEANSSKEHQKDSSVQQPCSKVQKKDKQEEGTFCNGDDVFPEGPNTCVEGTFALDNKPLAERSGQELVANRARRLRLSKTSSSLSSLSEQEPTSEHAGGADLPNLDSVLGGFSRLSSPEGKGSSDSNKLQVESLETDQHPIANPTTRRNNTRTQSSKSSSCSGSKQELPPDANTENTDTCPAVVRRSGSKLLEDAATKGQSGVPTKSRLRLQLQKSTSHMSLGSILEAEWPPSVPETPRVPELRPAKGLIFEAPSPDVDSMQSLQQSFAQLSVASFERSATPCVGCWFLDVSLGWLALSAVGACPEHTVSL